MKKKDIQEEINEFLVLWGVEEMHSLLQDIIPILDLYNVDREDDWVKKAVGDEDVKNVRLVRTVYLLSRLAESHASRLFNTNLRFKNLWQRMEEEVK